MIPPTTRQIELIRAVYPEMNAYVLTRREASVLLARYFDSQPATPKQIAYLRYLGYPGDAATLSKSAACREIQIILQTRDTAPEPEPGPDFGPVPF